MGGFYNPYARSVAYDFAPRKPQALQENAESPAPRADPSNGFTNPYSRGATK